MNEHKTTTRRGFVTAAGAATLALALPIVDTVDSSESQRVT